MDIIYKGMKARYIDMPTDGRIQEIIAFMFKDRFNIKLHSASEIKEFFKNDDELKYFCWQFGFYQLPTKELIDWLKETTASYLPSEVLEIGAGGGQIGSHLGIRMTDNKLQDDPAISAYYKLIQSPTVTYHPDVERLDGNLAVRKYQPKAVIACWVTEYPRLPFGVNELQIITEVEKYIFVGNINTHFEKAILQGLKGLYFDWILSRGNQKDNRIWMITKKK